MPDERQGLAFGIKQGSVPGATLLAGLAVPGIALTVGWRWTFVAGAVLAIPAVATMPRFDRPLMPAARGSVVESSRRPLPSVWMFAGAVGLAMAAVSAMGAFFVESVVDTGVSVEAAGLLLALGSACDDGFGDATRRTVSENVTNLGGTGTEFE